MELPRMLLGRREKLSLQLWETLGDFGTLRYPESSLFAPLVYFGFFCSLLSSSTFTPSVFNKMFLFICFTPFSLTLPPAKLLSLLSPSVLHWIQLQTSFIAVPPPLVSAFLSPASPPLPPLPYLVPPSLPASAPLSLPVSSVTIPPPLQDPFYLHITPRRRPTPTQPARRRSSVKY